MKSIHCIWLLQATSWLWERPDLHIIESNADLSWIQINSIWQSLFFQLRKCNIANFTICLLCCAASHCCSTEEAALCDSLTSSYSWFDVGFGCLVPSSCAGTSLSAIPWRRRRFAQCPEPRGSLRRSGSSPVSTACSGFSWWTFRLVVF